MGRGDTVSLVNCQAAKDAKKGYLLPVDAPDPREDDRVFLQKALPMSQVSPDGRFQGRQ